MLNKKIYREEIISRENNRSDISENASEESFEGKKIFVRTFGCQMNEKDSERIIGMLKGGIAVNSPEEADIIILNTCAVREKPEHKVYSEAGKYLKIRKHKKNLKVGVTGCVAQLKGSEIIKKVDVDFVVGTAALYKIPNIIKEVLKGKVVVDTSLDVNLSDRFESPIPYEFYNGSRVKAYVTIQEGCNQFCTFCVVPMTRGREITRPASDIIREIVELVSSGVREVTLIGQNVNGYGWNTPGEISFAQLLRQINKIDGLYRIRFTTSNPRYMNDELIDAMAECDKVCEHLHLPVQSGSNRTLKKMGRRHTIEEYYEILEKLRKAIPNCAITTDIIVGFPGETDQDFEETMNLIKTIRFDDIFSFKFSPRPGTIASRMTDQIPEDIKSERLRILQATQDEITKQIMQSYIGKVEEILVEGPAERNQETDSTGRTRTNKVVNFKGNPKPGEIVKIKITEAFRNSLRGEIAENVV
ncbi:MAG: tRNA (N6-isopentenyl adenosine(37)-C2)-methylthiotransferase MiaB [Candidatus Calescibacterium sp.]|nr:tRNA (N6-isopentenyl adenosine(37)-C2)-methylthiotransferase MiaB [Candidatus Calescibacterium sp.]MDW8087203.1 tRNA (N6-isopentenyl adenosine(37)-C2)-methylthiotransferase MiaB [Candidatus Calescibacterium sp.]